MEAQPTNRESVQFAQRDRLLRRLIVCFAAAAAMTYGMAVTMSLWHQAEGDLVPVALGGDLPH